MTSADAEWIRLNVLPPLWRRDDGVEELRTCLCQASPSDWLGGIDGPEARLWNRDGRTVADGGGLVLVWLADRICRRRKPDIAA